MSDPQTTLLPCPIIDTGNFGEPKPGYEGDPMLHKIWAASTEAVMIVYGHTAEQAHGRWNNFAQCNNQIRKLLSAETKLDPDYNAAARALDAWDAMEEVKKLNLEVSHLGACILRLYADSLRLKDKAVQEAPEVFHPDFLNGEKRDG